MRGEPVPTDTVDPKQLLNVLMAMKKGNFSVRMPVDQTGIAGKIADALNDVIDLNEKLCAEMARISTVVGKEGKPRECKHTKKILLANPTNGAAPMSRPEPAPVVTTMRIPKPMLASAMTKGFKGQTIAERRQEMVCHSRLSCHTGGLLPFAADSRQEDLLQVDPECVNGYLRLTGALVERLENHRQPSFGFALGHVYEAAENLRLLLSLVPPLRDPDLLATVLAWTDAALLISFATHE